MKELLLEFLAVLCVTFVLTAILGRLIIPILRSKKVGQHILEIGPRWHRSKEGTPTMGGICFILAILLTLVGVLVLYAVRGEQSKLIPLALTMVLAVLNGMIGFVDDFCKLVKKKNEGLKMHQKTVLQLAVAIFYICLLRVLGYVDTSLHIPFTDIVVELGVVYYVFAVLIIYLMVNSVNLTDGIDGLASSVTIIVFGFFAFVGLNALNASVSLISAAIIGGLLGFLIYNLNPARVFMGDTGSLFLGGAVTGTAFLMGEPLLLLLIGGVYVIESISVMLQVGSFKLRQKRIFKMAPIHHHFEKCGWSENKVVIVFSAVTLIFCVLAWFGL